MNNTMIHASNKTLRLAVALTSLIVATAMAAEPAGTPPRNAVPAKPAPAAAAPAKPAPKAPATTGILATVLEYGYYRVETEGNLYSDATAPSGKVQAGATVNLAELTDQIPVEKGRLFGFQFRITGFDTQDTVVIREVVTHPKMTKPDGTVSTGYTSEVGLNVRQGEVTDYAGYRLDNDYELVDGPWKFEFWLGDKKILEQSFTTVSNHSRAKKKNKAAG